MIKESCFALPPVLPHGAAGLEHCQVATLILDRMGRIASCGEAVEAIFSETQSSLIGRGIAELIGGLCLGGTSPSYTSRYLDYLSGDGNWRRFEVRDAVGDRFPVEIKLAPIASEGQRLFLLNIRNPKGTGEPAFCGSGVSA